MSGEAEIEAARLLLDRLGVSAEELMQESQAQVPVPTFADYIPTVSATLPEGTRRAYQPYWQRVVQQWGDRHLDAPTASDIQHLAEHVKERAVQRRNGRGGRSAAEHLISALRCVYNHAVADGLIPETRNPARKVRKPRRLPSTRRGLLDERLAEINHVAGSTGNDPALDSLLMRLHIETACRRGGALALRPRDLEPGDCVVALREKGGTQRLQPVSPTLMNHLLAHAEHRGAHDPDGPLLRYRNGSPVSRRRYDSLWKRLGEHLPWVASQGISTHWLRHTTLTWVERNFGYAVARAYAGHTGSHDIGSTATYIRADLQEVATALAATPPGTLTGATRPAAPPWAWVRSTRHDLVALRQDVQQRAQAAAKP